MTLRKTIALTVAGVTSLSVVIGMRERAVTAESVSDSAPVADAVLPGVVVNARRPGLSEIVDLVLRERPTAAELMGRTIPAVGFPKGSDEAYVAAILGRRNSDRALVDHIAAALVRESRRRHVGSSLLVGVMLTENPSLDPRATSSAGARGLMQVMPFHAGRWGCNSSDLFDIESNICHGVAVLADNLYRSRTLPQALLGYNGCVRGINTPDCWLYPRHVYLQGRLPPGTTGN